MIPSSLTGRLLLVSMVVLLLFLPLAGIVLEQAYSNSLDRRLQEQLKVQVYGLMGLADEIEPGELWLPESLPDERFNQLASGRYAKVINADGKLMWQSQSSLNLALNTVNKSDVPGQFIYQRLVTDESQTLEASRVSVIWESTNNVEHLYTFIVAESIEPLLAEKRAFRDTLLFWLGGLAIFLLIVDVFALFWALKPLKRLAEEIRQIEQGDIQTLQTEYPTELNKVAHNLNTLIIHSEQQRSRYRNTLQDLAHSLKTPLSVLQAGLSKIDKPDAKEMVSTQVSRMNDLVRYQLQRAVSAGNSPIKHRVNVSDCVDKILAALGKVYHDKNIQFSNKISKSCIFYGDENDLLEIFGNLCDNACKYGQSLVMVADEATGSSNTICIKVVDDGMGIPEKQQQLIFERGQRLDENNEGQGIGLSVVNDIVSSYRGHIDIAINELKQNTIRVVLPGAVSAEPPL